MAGPRDIRVAMQKVSVYIRYHSTPNYELAQQQTIYPRGAIFVLRYGTRSETLKGVLTRAHENAGSAARTCASQRWFVPSQNRTSIVIGVVT